jgi:hypothetical protein
VESATGKVFFNVCDTAWWRRAGCLRHQHIPLRVAPLEVPTDGRPPVFRQSGIVREFQDGAAALAQVPVFCGSAAGLAEAVVASVL